MTKEDKITIIHHLLRAMIMTGFALYIIDLVRSGSMTLYIAPRMVLYVKLSAIGLYATAIYLLYSAVQVWVGNRTAAHDCDHEPSPSVIKNTLIYGLFILPLIMGFLLPDTMLGSTAASKKGISLNGTGSFVIPENAEAQPFPDADNTDLDALFPADEYTASYARLGKRLYGLNEIVIPEKQYMETLTALDLYRDNFIGKTVEISGFVYRQEGMGTSQLAVSRFAMNCCSADSLPYGLMIENPQAADYDDDVWLNVRGTVTVGIFEGNPIVILKAAQIKTITPPSTPYVYPDYEFDL
ncbi:TIGR03943 family putative permease subunit [Paenibacillus sepulcri]|uniref:TIGR03943 family protein n=1 Tax=Paenibacillus sepulcri TaxID=359917 RepID=A0ABS7BXN4_9BACL|nr:TIGR03943 family protein [Paenibacillus sepulcri]